MRIARVDPGTGYTYDLVMDTLGNPAFSAFMAAVDPTGASAARFAIQARHIVHSNAAQFEGARVLDIGAGDGRWSAFAAAAGAADVTALEARRQHADTFANAAKGCFSNVRYEIGDMFERLRAFKTEGRSFDIVLLFGVLFHTTDHAALLGLVLALGPDVLLLDTEVSCMNGSAILVATEPTDDPMNAASFDGAPRALVGVPTVKALETICEVLGARVAWHDWSDLTDDERPLVAEYCRNARIVRRTCEIRSLP